MAAPIRKPIQHLLTCFGVILLMITPMAALGAGAASSLLSGPASVTLPERSDLVESSRILDARGRLIASLHGEENRIVVPPEAIPEVVREAVIAVEDERFYEHAGVDPAAIMRSLMRNVSEQDVVQGGSTITQQYVRNTFQEVGRAPTLARKIKEAMTALRVEQELSKDEILHRYLNAVYFGRGAYGIEAAAREFFGRPAAKLTLPQAAALAATIRGPHIYTTHQAAWIERRNHVLRRMREAGFIDQTTERRATSTTLGIALDSAPTATAAYFVEYVRRLLTTPEGDGGFGMSHKEVLGGGLTINTTLDLDQQRTAEHAVASVLDRRNDPEAGFVVMTTSGEIRAMVGGRSFTSIERARGFNFAAQTARGQGRPSGSTFKVFTLASYIERGLSLGRSYRAPSRIRIPDPECSGPDGDWQPANYGRRGYGRMNVIRATEQSVNTVFAQMVADVGPENAMRMAQRLGIESPLSPVCSLTLGVFGVTPLEMARAYATFAARGIRPEIVAVTSVMDRAGKVLVRRDPGGTRVIEAKVADTVNAILQRVVRNGTGRPARTIRASAGKTGTTDDFRDVWYAGYTPHPGLSGVVWIGYPPDAKGQIKPMLNVHGRRATGGGLAGLIWKSFMDRALRNAADSEFEDVKLSRGGEDGPDTGRGRLYLVRPNEAWVYPVDPVTGAPMSQWAPQQEPSRRGRGRGRR